MKTKEEINMNPKATFYAVLYADFRKTAIECGYALALHGSMVRDMDLIAVAWTEDAKPVEELVSKINDCIGNTIWKERNLRDKELRMHGRITYTICIMGDWFIDLSVIPPISQTTDICSRCDKEFKTEIVTRVCPECNGNGYVIASKEKEEKEYEMFFCSDVIQGWYPIATERLRNQDKIEEYIKSGILRRIK